MRRAWRLGLLVPRLYSLASSPLAFPARVHLLVASVRYTVRGRERHGVPSTWLEERWPLGKTATCFLQDQQKHFAMPARPDTPMIMSRAGRRGEAREYVDRLTRDRRYKQAVY